MHIFVILEGKYILSSGQSLYTGQYLMSRNGKYFFWLQNDGNLVLYKCLHQHCTSSTRRHHIWASNTNGKGNGPYKLIMQDNNYLVLYDASSKPIWWVGNSISQYKWLKGGYVIIQDDGNFVMYDGEHKLIWDTATYNGRQGVYGEGRNHVSSII